MLSTQMKDFHLLKISWSRVSFFLTSEKPEVLSINEHKLKDKDDLSLMARDRLGNFFNKEGIHLSCFKDKFHGSGILVSEQAKRCLG